MEEKNMYAVVATGGKQYKIKEGETLRIEKVDGNVGDAFTFDQVLLVADGDSLAVGQPMIEGASVSAHIVEQGKSKKILVFKYKRRKRYRRKQGHRQMFTAVRVDNIHSA
jgi:large subunit ribosomal protein L21